MKYIDALKAKRGRDFSNSLCGPPTKTTKTVSVVSVSSLHEESKKSTPPWPPRPRELASWPIERRQRWGEMANQFEDQGLAWNEAERRAFDIVKAASDTESDHPGLHTSEF
jgi:hypothetical protein